MFKNKYEQLLGVKKLHLWLLINQKVCDIFAEMYNFVGYGLAAN